MLVSLSTLLCSIYINEAVKWLNTFTVRHRCEMTQQCNRPVNDFQLGTFTWVSVDV